MKSNTARLLYQRQQYQEAEADLRRAINANPNHMGALELLAELLLIDNRFDEAQQTLEKLFDIAPERAYPRLKQVYLDQLQRAANSEQRRAIVDRAAERMPDDPDICAERSDLYRQIGADHEAQGRLDEALQAYEQAADEQAILRVRTRIRQHEVQRALAELAQLKVVRDYITAKSRIQALMEAYPADHNWQHELDTVERAILLDEYYRQALGALQQHDPVAAKRLLAEVVALDPDYEEASRYLYQAVTGSDPKAEREQRDATITRLQHDLEQRDATISQKQRDLEQRDATITRLQHDLEQRDVTITRLQHDLDQRDATITRLQHDLEQRDAIISQKQRDLEQRDATISQKQRDLEQRDASIASLRHDLEQRDATISRQQRDLEQRDDTIASLRRDLKQRDDTIDRFKSLPQLSRWNPFDWLRLLWWIFMRPATIDDYEKTYGNTELVGSRLVYLLSFGPMFIVTLGFSFGLMGEPSAAFLEQTQRTWIWQLRGWMPLLTGLVWLLFWLLSDLLDDVGETWVLMAGIVAGGVTGGVTVGVALGVTVGVALGVALGVVLGVVLGVTVGVAFGVAGGVAGDVMLGVMLGMMLSVMLSVMAGVASIVAGDLAGDLAGVVAFGVALGVAFGVISRMFDLADKMKSERQARLWLFLMLIMSWLYLIFASSGGLVWLSSGRWPQPVWPY